MNDRHPTDADRRPTVTIAEAARMLGLTSDAVRSRLHRGTLPGEKVGNRWHVFLPDDREVNVDNIHIDPDPTAERRPPTVEHPSPTDADRRATDATPVVDLQPLAELIERQGRELAEAQAVAAMWQTRAMHLEDQLKQLTATVERNDETVDAAASNETDDEVAPHQRDAFDAPAGIWSRLVRWWKG